MKTALPLMNCLTFSKSFHLSKFQQKWENTYLNVVKVNQESVGKSGQHIIDMLYKYKLYLDKFLL